MWRREKTSHQCILDVYLMRGGVEWMGAGYHILACVAEPLHFPKTLLEYSGLLSNYKTVSLGVFMACAHSTFPVRRTLKVGANCTH